MFQQSSPKSLALVDGQDAQAHQVQQVSIWADECIGNGWQAYHVAAPELQLTCEAHLIEGVVEEQVLELYESIYFLQGGFSNG